MKLETTYEEVLEHYPQAVREVLENQRLSSSMHKDLPPEDLNWFYEWCVRVECVSLIDRMANTPPPKPEYSLEEKFANFERDAQDGGSITMWVLASKQRGRWRSNRIRTLPPSVRAHIEEIHHRDVAEKERLASLTPEQREQEVEGLLKQLRGPGFIEIRNGKVIK